jgi:hypothetical protein
LGFVVGVSAWFQRRAGRIRLIADSFGIWHCGKRFVPWGDILGAERVSGTTFGGEDYDGVVIGLAEDTPHPWGRMPPEILKIETELDKSIEETGFTNPFYVQVGGRDWRPGEFVALVERCVADPVAREELREYDAWAAGRPTAGRHPG